MGRPYDVPQKSPLTPLSAPMPSVLSEQALDQSPREVLSQVSFVPISRSRAPAALQYPPPWGFTSLHMGNIESEDCLQREG